MPIYEYACRSCGHRFELLVLKSTVVACPKCAHEDLERLERQLEEQDDDDDDDDDEDEAAEGEPKADEPKAEEPKA